MKYWGSHEDDDSLKRQKVREQEECYVELSIHHAEDIDRATATATPTSSDFRLYQVNAWVLPKSYQDRMTPVVFGLPNPAWNWVCHVPIGTYESDKFMHLEVRRVGCKSDPCTSNRTVSVGRTRIPLPRLGRKVSGRFGLVNSNSDRPGTYAAGHIVVTMRTGVLY